MAEQPFSTNPERLEELVEEATMDCYDEDEQHSGLLTVIGEQVGFPFEAKVIGEVVQITDVEWPNAGYGLKFTCEKKGASYEIDVGSIEWMEPLPEGLEWIEASLSWVSML